jgi:hypothetical protein
VQEHLGLVIILGGVALVVVGVAMAYFTWPPVGRVQRRH